MLARAMRLQGRFLSAIIPALAVSLLGLGAIVYGQLISNSRQNVEREAQMAQERVGLRLAAVVEAAETTAVLLSDSAQIADWFSADPSKSNESSSADAVTSLFRKIRKTQPLYRELRLINRDGDEEIRVADSDLGNVSLSEAGTGWFNRVALNWGASVHTEVIPHTDDGAASLTVARPIRLQDEQAGSPYTLRGYVVLSARMDAIAAQVANRAIGSGGFVAMVDDAGELVYTSGSSKAEADQVARLMFSEQDENTGLSRKKRIEFDGRRYEVSSHPEIDGVSIMVVVPGTAMEAIADQIGKTVGLVTLAAILLFSLLFLGLVRSIVVAPVKRLQAIITSSGEGEATTSLGKAFRDDEIGDLAESFESMNLKLSDSMSQLQDSHSRVESLAYEDVLTELPNRRRFLELLDESLRNTHDHNGRAALLFFDLDDFKRLNDGDGHRAGDRVLQEVAKRLRDCIAFRKTLRSSSELSGLRDQAARLGGDEFVVLLCDVQSDVEASAFAISALESLDKSIVVGGKERVIKSSVGIALYPRHATEADALIACADTAMYEAKGRKTHSWCLYDTCMREDRDARLSLEKDLREALQGQLRLQYQPQFHINNDSSQSNSKLWGMEALLRWQHPERGIVSPADFIPVAEETGLIAEIGSWVIDEACRQWTEWNDLDVAPERIAVNVSQRQFSLGDVVSTVQSTLKKYGMPPSALELEITESCMMDASTDVIGSLEYIRKLGVHIAMDDFGTGHSSLGALTQLPIDTLKVDRCFVSGIAAGLPNDAIVAAVLMLADTLNLTVVAEGVETDSELERLRWHGCDVWQGNLLARPLWSSDATALLEQRRAAAPSTDVYNSKAA